MAFCYSFPYVLLFCLNFTLFILSASSFVPTVIIKSPPTSMGYALVIVSSISLFSSFLGFFSPLAHFCFVTHVTFLITSLSAQFLAILTLLTKEKASLSMLKSQRDPREAMALVRLECGVFMVMFVLQIGVLCFTCAVNRCRVKKYETLDKESLTKPEIKEKELEKIKTEF